MGIRPSSFKGGGYLNNVDVTFVGYKFTSKTFEWGIPVNVDLMFQVEGGEAPTTTFLKVGDATNYGGITPDGLRILTPEGQSLGKQSQLGVFLASLVKAGCPEDQLDDNEAYISLECLVGSRMRLVNQVNEDKTKKFGQQEGKDGKKYDRKDLLVEKFYGMAVGAKKATNGSGKAMSTDLTGTATTITKAILTEQGGEVSKTKLPVLTGKKLMGNPQGTELRKIIQSEAFLAGSEAWLYDPATQMLTAV